MKNDSDIRIDEKVLIVYVQYEIDLVALGDKLLVKLLAKFETQVDDKGVAKGDKRQQYHGIKQHVRYFTAVKICKYKSRKKQTKIEDSTLFHAGSPPEH